MNPKACFLPRGNGGRGGSILELRNREEQEGAAEKQNVEMRLAVGLLGIPQMHVRQKPEAAFGMLKPRVTSQD